VRKNVFQEIADMLTQRVNDGTYGTSQKLPSDYELAEEFQCSRLTVRKAIDLLITQNILVKEKGKGTYVMKQPKIQSGSGGLQSFTETAQTQGKKTRTEILQVETVNELPTKISQMFGSYAQEPMIYLTRLRYFEDEPMTVENLYILKRYLGNETEEITQEQLKSSLYQIIEANIEIGYSHQEVEAIKSPSEIAKLLHVPEEEPMLLVHSMTYSPAAKPILFDTSFYRADKYTFKNTLVRQK
jgi:GntR family transcriptional regulator